MSVHIENDADAAIVAADQFPATAPLAGAIARALPNACLLAAATGLMFAAPALATTYQVTNTNDAGSGSLRDALNQANANTGADIITFAANVTGTISLTTGSLPITDAVDIQGPGASVLAVDGSGITVPTAPQHTNALASGSYGNDFVINGHSDSPPPPQSPDGTSATTASATPVTISGLTITGGNATVSGGAIYAYHSILNVNNCVVSNNTAQKEGGGIFIQGGDGEGDYYSILTVNDSVVSGNYAYYAGGGIAARDSTAVTIQRSTIANNTTHGGDGGDYGGGGIFIHADDSTRPLTISSSTISGNHSYSEHGGGGVYIRHSSAIISNSTIYGNTSEYGGGGVVVHIDGTADYSITIGNSTITNNRAGTFGGGILLNYDGGTVTLANTVIGGNSANINADISSYGNVVATFAIEHSLIQTPGSALITDNGGNQLSVAPMLGSLSNNGGPTLTQLPLVGSPLINAGDPAFTGLTEDQRGTGFPRVVNSIVDIGATEFGVAAVPTVIEPAPDLGLGGKLGLGALLGLAGLAVARRRRNLGGSALGLLMATMLAAAPMPQAQAAAGHQHRQSQAVIISSFAIANNVVTVQLSNAQTITADSRHVQVVDKRSNVKSRRVSSASIVGSNTPATLHVETNSAGKVVSLRIRLVDSLQRAQALVAQKP